MAGLTVTVPVVAPPGDQEYVPPAGFGVAEICPVSPWHKIVPLAVTVGTGVTFTVAVAVTDPHPLNIYVTVYVVVVAGLTVILLVVSSPGDHEYVPPPMDGVAEIWAWLPTHILAPVVVTVGGGDTTTCAVAVMLPQLGDK